MFLSLLLLTACPDERSDAAETSACVDTSTVIALDDASHLGFSPADILAMAPPSSSAGLEYADGVTVTGLAIDVTHDAGEARFIDAEPAPRGDGENTPAIEIYCPDRIEVDVNVDFVTEDGQFAEHWSLPLAATDATVATFYKELDLAALGGTFVVEDHVDTSGYDETRFWIDGSFQDGLSTGTVAGQGSGTEEGCEGDECMAFAEMLTIGTWESAEME